MIKSYLRSVFGSLIKGEKNINICNFQGCWGLSDGCNEECILTPLLSTSLRSRLDNPERVEGLEFCCCTKSQCNEKWRKPANQSIILDMEGAQSVDLLPDQKKEDLLLIVAGLCVVLALLMLAALTAIHARNKRMKREYLTLFNEFNSDKAFLVSK